MTRSEEKQLLRNADHLALDENVLTKEQIQEQNAFIKARYGLIIDFSKAPVAG